MELEVKLWGAKLKYVSEFAHCKSLLCAWTSAGKGISSLTWIASLVWNFEVRYLNIPKQHGAI